MAQQHIVVDGSNIATEGRTAPSLAQLDEAVRAFLGEYGEHLALTVVVDATFGHRIDPKEKDAFDAGIGNGELVTPPAGAIGRGDACVLQIADKAGATKMDRPEWGAVDPGSGDVYFTLTNNNKRAQTQVDAVNPRAENNFGQIVRWRYAGNDHSATTFQWDLFVLAGNKGSSALFTGKALDENGIFACPDGLSLIHI